MSPRVFRIDNALTWQCFQPNGVLPGSPRLVDPSSLPVSPARNVVQALIEVPVAKILGRHDPVLPGVIHQIIECYPSLDAATRYPGGRNGTLAIELYIRNSGFFNYRCAALCSMLEQQVVELGSDL